MGKVNVVIVDATGNKEQKVGLPDDIKCGIIMVKLVEKIKLPSVGPDGNPISYKFIHKVTGRQLLEAQTLAEAGIKDGDVLRLQPEITAGAVCPVCGAAEPDGKAFCSQCGTSMNVYAQPPVQSMQPPVQPPMQQPYYPNAGFNARPASKSKLIFILGTIGAGLIVLYGFIMMFSADMDYETMDVISFLYYSGVACFFMSIVFYMTERLRKQDK